MWDDKSQIPTTPLISIIKRTHDSYINNKISKYNLSSGTYPILIAIFQNDRIIQEEIANLFHLNESTITRAINKLEKNGFIKKSLDNENKRENYIKITDKGKKVALSVMNFEKEWDEYYCRNLDDEEFLTYKKILLKLCDNLVND